MYFKKIKYEYLAIEAACFSGNMNLIEFVISSGAKNWNAGLIGGCKSGNKEVIEYMIKKGANNWNEALFKACEEGNKVIIELMVNKGADNWPHAFYYAYSFGNKDAALFILRLFGFSTFDPNYLVSNFNIYKYSTRKL